MQQQQIQQIQQTVKPDDLAHKIVDYLGDHLGYLWILLFLPFGILFFFRKRSKSGSNE